MGRRGTGTAAAVDITEVILSQHHEQRRMFAMLDEIPRDDTAALAAVWKRLEVLLEVHAEAEERFFYPQLLKLGKRGAGDADDARGRGRGRDQGPQRDPGRRPRGGAARGGLRGVVDGGRRGAGEANGDHMAEEEREDLRRLPPPRRPADPPRHRRAVPQFEAEHARGIPPEDKDPEEYVAEHG